PCGAQEVEGVGKNGPAIFSNAGFLEVTTPLTNRVQANLYGFYLGNVQSSLAMAELPVKVQKYVTITPAYLWIGVPPSGLSLVTCFPISSSHRENKSRLSSSFTTPTHHFIVPDRNMSADLYPPHEKVTLSRNRLYVAHPISFGRYKTN